MNNIDQIKSGGKTFKLNIGELVRFETDISHYYFLDGQFLPGATTILSEASPTPYGLKVFWQNNTKDEADQIFESAGSFGSKMHDAFERLLLAQELNLLTEYPSEKEKKCLMSFKDWFATYTPEQFEAEQPVASKKFQYAGTLDFVGILKKMLPCCIAGEHEGRWLIDFKTSNAIHMSHQLQVLAYKQAYEESWGVTIDHVAIARFGTIHKGNGEAKDGKLKETGKNWEFKEVTKFTIDDFMRIYNVYLMLHGGEIPVPNEIAVYPETLKLIDEVKI